MMDAAEAIREARLSRGLSARRLAKLSGVTQRAMTYWEGGHRAPGIDVLTKLANVLDVEFVIQGDGVIWRDDPRRISSREAV